VQGHERIVEDIWEEVSEISGDAALERATLEVVLKSELWIILTSATDGILEVFDFFKDNRGLWLYTIIRGSSILGKKVKMVLRTKSLVKLDA
jgi:hypothetical protein